MYTPIIDQLRPPFIEFLVFIFYFSICIHCACFENTIFSGPSTWFMTKPVITKPVWPPLFIFIRFWGIHAPPNILCTNSNISQNYEIRFYSWFSGLLIAVCFCATPTTLILSLVHAVHGAVLALHYKYSCLLVGMCAGLVSHLSAAESYYVWFR